MQRPLDSAGSILHALRAAGVDPGARLCTDSRQLRAGDVFVAWPGAAADARRHVAAAFARGARAAVVEAHGAEAFELPPGTLRVRGLRELAGPVADAWWQHPSRRMRVLAVTGTNGKTSCALWTAQALAAAGRPCGVIGTLGVGMPGALVSTGLTTPDPVRLHAELARMVAAGVAYCAIEASSIGIEEQRLAGLHLHAAALTNLSQDHLDYHGDMHAYAAAKRKLFDVPGLRHAVCNVDDALGAELARHAQQRGLQVARVSLRGDAGVQWSAPQCESGLAGMRVRVRGGDREALLELPLLGAFNASNVLVVCGLLQACGLEFDAAMDALHALQAPPGRMQMLGGAAAPLVVVDYAHTPDALAQVLEALRPVAARRGGNLWCVFGAGGDRDAGKRAPMARAAEQLADRVVLTSDNPRSEAPQDIVDALLRGAAAPASIMAVLDRAEAVSQTVAHAGAADVVLIAGKGHEATQELAGRKTPFNDVFHARAALAARGGGWFNVRELAAWCGVPAQGDANTPIQGVCTDSRRLRSGDLFIALRGERFDAHEFLPGASAAGACAAIAERGLAASGLPGIEVADARRALGLLAHAWRRQQPAAPVIAVTGSNGKTTVTQMLARILRAWHGDDAYLATEGNFNNDVGLPLTLLRLRPQHLAAVVEIGMNHPGEVAQLVQLAEPTVALVNNAQREHQEFMHSVEAVARENGAVLQGLSEQGVAVFPATDAHAGLWAELAGPRACMRFALREPGQPGPAAEVEGWVEQPGGADAPMLLDLRTPAGQAQLRLRVLGPHHAHNALAATAAALAAGAPLAAVVAGLEAFEPVAGRMQRSVVQGPDGRTLLLIDDTYNANPDSVRAAIDTLAALPGRRLLVLGDMGEVGTQGPEFHAEVGAHAARAGLDGLWAVGEAASHAADAARAAGMGAVRHVQSWEQLGLEPGRWPDFDAVLVKGSRFMRMERVVAVLRAADRAGASKETGHAA